MISIALLFVSIFLCIFSVVRQNGGAKVNLYIIFVIIMVMVMVFNIFSLLSVSKPNEFHFQKVVR